MRKEKDEKTGKDTLQWGPSLSAWEIIDLFELAVKGGALQWGPSLSAWEIPLSMWKRRTSPPRLQWGPSLSAWEMVRHHFEHVRPNAASMGPKLISLGNIVSVVVDATACTLQWGPSLSAWEILNRRVRQDNRVSLQWGPSLSAWEMAAMLAGIQANDLASMGPKLIS